MDKDQLSWLSFHFFLIIATVLVSILYSHVMLQHSVIVMISIVNSFVRLMRVGVRVWVLCLMSVCTLWLWPIYLLCRLTQRWERPPTIPRLSQVLRYLKYTWTVESPSSKPLLLLDRVYLTLQILNRVVFIPLNALFWYLDELIYGRELDEEVVESPFFIMSGMRSGSTQTGLYLSSDPTLLSPLIIQCIFPYLWLWKWFPYAMIDRYFISITKLRKSIMSKVFPKSFMERHEGDMLFQPDTFDVAFCSFHLNYMSDAYGHEIFAMEIGTGSYAPHNRSMWEEDFVNFVDRIARKTLLFHGARARPDTMNNQNSDKTDLQSPSKQRKQFWLKGHFLCAGDALERRFPDAQFLTLIREPAQRIRSCINWIGVCYSDPFLGEKSWQVTARAIEKSETIYCEMEQDWFQRKRKSIVMEVRPSLPSGEHQRDGKEGNNARNRQLLQQQEEKHPYHIVRFKDFCENDVTTTMEYIYLNCLGRDHVPTCIPQNHPERNRVYTVDKTFQELGIDEEKINERLKSYVSWCRGDKLHEQEPETKASIVSKKNSIENNSMELKSSCFNPASKKLQ